MAEDRGRTPFTAELAVGALVAAATLPMTRLFADGFGSVALLALVLGVGIAVGTRRVGLGAVGSWAISMLGLFWFVAVKLFPATLWGPFPSGRSLTAIGAAIRDGAEKTINEIAPVDPSPELLMFAAAGIWMTAWLIDATLVRLQNPVLAVAAAVPLFVVPGAILTSLRLGLEIGLFLIAASLVLFHDQVRRFIALSPAGTEERPTWRLASGARIVIIAVAVVATFTSSLPGFGAPPALTTQGIGNQIYFNPIVSIKPTLDDDRNVELIRARMSSPTYLRLTALDVFDGRIWQPRSERGTVPFPPDTREYISSDFERVRQEVAINALAGPWLPAAYQATSVTGDPAEIDPVTDTIYTGTRLHTGKSYTVESRVPNPSVAALDRPVAYDRRALADLLRLPGDLPRELTTIARDITDGATTPYQQALALQRELRSFAYDENIAQGHSFDDMVTFLTEVQAGYCEQFAGTMAVLARILGIPSRVVIGFGVGDFLGNDLYSITTRHAHAWVELWFPQSGWVLFEPTPRAGVTRLPEYAPAATAPDVEAPDDPADPAVDDNASPPPDEEEPLPTDPGTSGGAATGPGLRMPILAGVLLLVAIGGGPVWRALRRRRRLARATTARELVAAHYVDFLDWCEGAGLAKRLGETPAEHATRIAARAGDARADLETLVGLVEEALWAPPNGLVPSEAERAAAGVRAAIQPSLTRVTRARAVLRWPGFGRR